MGAKYSARLQAQPRPPALHGISPIGEYLAVLDCRSPPRAERGLVRRAVRWALEVQRPVVLECDRAWRQPMHLEAAAAGGNADIRREFARPRADRHRAWAEQQRAPVHVAAGAVAAEQQPWPTGVAPGRALGQRQVD